MWQVMPGGGQSLARLHAGSPRPPAAPARGRAGQCPGQPAARGRQHRGRRGSPRPNLSEGLGGEVHQISRGGLGDLALGGQPGQTVAAKNRAAAILPS